MNLHFLNHQILIFSLEENVCFDYKKRFLFYFFPKLLEAHYMSLGQKLELLKIRSTSVTFLSLRNLKAAPEETMQLRGLIKSSNESL